MVTALTPNARKRRIDELAELADDDHGVSLLPDAWRRLRRSTLFWIGAVIITIFVLRGHLRPVARPARPRRPIADRSGQPGPKSQIPPAAAGVPARR